MSKFQKYVGKLNFEVKGEPFCIDFRVRDRIVLASIYDNTTNQSKYAAMSEFCIAIIMKNYPEETKEEVESFLTSNMDEFITELMISASLMKREDITKAKEEVKKVMLQ